MIDLVKQIETNKLVSYRGLRKIFDENLKNSSFFWGGGKYESNQQWRQF